jgi:hypothetical protein
MASDAGLRIFTVEEANRAVKDLRKTLPALRRILGEVELLEDKLAVLGLICDRAVAADNPDLREYLATKLRYHRKISEFEGMWKALESQGYLVRDLEKGVVHFASRRGKQNVFLCWREGEARVSHWHAGEESRPDEESRRDIDRHF